MKAVLACCGAFGLLVLAGPVSHLASAVHPQQATGLPGWINLPANGSVESVAYLGGPGQEVTSGNIEFAIDGDASQAVSAMKARLAANGFIVSDELSAEDRFMGATAYAVASDPVSGRNLHILQLAAPGGSLLRVSYEDPASVVAYAE